MISTVVAVIVGAVGTDFGAAIFAEYRLPQRAHGQSVVLRPVGQHPRFPVQHAGRAHRYEEIEIRAAGVGHPVTGKVSLEATLHGIGLTDSSWLIGPDAELPVDKVESRIILDSTHVGRFIGMKDLLVEAPTRETEDGFPGVTESGISSGQDLVFTGTPAETDFDKRVSVAVDVTLTDPGDTTLVMTATRVLTGPGRPTSRCPRTRPPRCSRRSTAASPGCACRSAWRPPPRAPAGPTSSSRASPRD